MMTIKQYCNGENDGNRLDYNGDENTDKMSLIIVMTMIAVTKKNDNSTYAD